MNKISWILGILLVVAALFVINVSRTCIETREQSEFYRHQLESSVELRHQDSLYFNGKIERLSFEYESRLREKDSVYRMESQNTTTSRTLVRTVYKDSVREVYVENTESIRLYEEQVAILRDSLSVALAQQDGVEVEYVETVKHDTIIVYRDAVDSSRTDREEKKTPALGRIGVYGDGTLQYGGDGFGYDVEAGAKVHLVEPLYLKAGIKFDGAVSGMVGAGIELRL